MRYFAGVPWSATERLVAMLLPVRGAPVIVCPRFELGSLQADLSIDVDIRLWEEDEDPHALVADALAGIGARTVAIDPALTFQMAERLRRAAHGRGAGRRRARDRRMPDAQVGRRDRADATGEGRDARGPSPRARIMAPGITTTESSASSTPRIRRSGRRGSSFCIVQYGRATAFPHGLPGEQRLAEGDLVLIDTGLHRRGLSFGHHAHLCVRNAVRSAACDLEPGEGGAGRRLCRRHPRRTLRKRRRGGARGAGGGRSRPGLSAARSAPSHGARHRPSRSTSPPIWSAATRPRSIPACAFPTSR